MGRSVALLATGLFDRNQGRPRISSGRRLPVVAHDKAGGQFLDRPGAAGSGGHRGRLVAPCGLIRSRIE